MRVWLAFEDFFMRSRSLNLLFTIATLVSATWTAQSASAVPLGFVKTTLPIPVSSASLVYAPSGNLYSLDIPSFGSNSATIRVIQPNLSFSAPLTFSGNDPGGIYFGGMTYDPVGNALLVTDNYNYGSGTLYSIDISTGTKTTIASGISAITDVAVRSTGEIFVSTSDGDNVGTVKMIDRSTGAATTVMTGLDYSAGIAFDNAGDLIVQEADAVDYTHGRLHKLPVFNGMSLTFGSPSLLLSGINGTYGLAIDPEGDFFLTGTGGLFEVAAGGPLTETSFDDNGNPIQFSTTLAFAPTTGQFEPYAAGNMGLAYLGDASVFGGEDQFITFLTVDSPLVSNPLVPEPGTGLMLIAGTLLLAKRRKKPSGI
jgi:hypothetical protein